MRICVTCVGLLFWVATSGAVHAADALDLRKDMPPEVFAEAGLAKLSGAQLRALEAWLQARGTQDVAVDAARAAVIAPVQPEAATPVVAGFGEEQLAPVPEPTGSKIEAHIKGEFTGWSGNTLFRLDNGQIWRQRIGGRYRFKAEAPAVEIFKGRFGYYMKLLDSGRQVAVKRVR